jgi:hypothetical protein
VDIAEDEASLTAALLWDLWYLELCSRENLGGSLD